jgi:hypothetical protein
MLYRISSIKGLTAVVRQARLFLPRSMFKEFLDNLELRADAMRRFHSAWLSNAFKRGSRPPRIPTRKVEDGGWGSMMETPEGRAWAEEFWQGALDHPEAG